MSDYTTEIPYGYCHCGCGNKTKLSDVNNAPRGLIKGQPYKFIRGHATKIRTQDNPITRFWMKVNKEGAIHPYNPKLGKCWEWLASKNKKGYGHFGFNGACWQAHRISWIFSYGEIPNDLLVLHSCDNPMCVRPDHLFLGTHQDNSDDKIKKGRQGKPIQKNKLTHFQADEIRMRYAAKELDQYQLAKEYGVCQRTINNIIHRRTSL